MKRTMIVLSALMMISSIIFAQKKDNHHRQRDGGIEKLKTELSLNDDQYASIKGINKKYGEQILQVRKDSTSSKNEKHTTLKSLREKRQNEINSVLSAEQKTKLTTLKKERSERRKAHMTEIHEKRQAQLINDLSLTNDQSIKLKDANKSFTDKVMKLRSQSSNDREANKAEMKKLRKEHEATVKSILTSDQFAKWKEIRKSANLKHKRKKDKK